MTRNNLLITIYTQKYDLNRSHVLKILRMFINVMMKDRLVYA